MNRLTYAEAKAMAESVGWQCRFCGQVIGPDEPWATDTDTGRPVCKPCLDRIPHIHLGKEIPA